MLFLFFPFLQVNNLKAQKTLILEVHPYLDKGEIIKRFTPLKNYLERETDLKIKLIVSRDYFSHIDSIGKNKVDIAFIGPEAYTKLTEIYGKPKIIGRIITNGTPYFRGIFIAKKNSPIKHIECLKNKSVAFVSKESTIGFVVPFYKMMNDGLFLNDFCCYKFLDSHINVALSVLAGDFDAGVVKEEVYKKFKKFGLKEIARTPKVYEHLFIARKSLPHKIFTKIKNAFFKLNSPRLLKILKNIKESITGFGFAKDSDYDSLRIINRFIRRSLANR